MNNNTNTAIAPKIDYTATETVCGSVLFPEVYAPGEIMIKRKLHRHPDCQLSNPDYIPEENMLRRILAWYFFPSMKPFGLKGESGTGKTEMALYLADKLNTPFYKVKVTKALMPEDLEGGKDLVATDKGVVSKISLGLAAKAYHKGGILVVDEIDKCNDALSAALHEFLDSKTWPIEQFSLMLNKHPELKIICTGNSFGEGGHERYHTSVRMDQALRSRIGWKVATFPTQERELAIMDKKFPKFPHAMKVDMVRLANAFRDALLGPDRDGKVDNPINAVFSTRTIVDWGCSTMCFGKKAIWREALDYAFQGSIDPEYVDIANDIIQRIFGNIIDLTVEEVVQKYLPVKKS